MKIVFHVVAAVAVVGLPFGIYALFYQPAVGGPILLSSAVYLGLFSIACRTKGKEPNG